MVLVDSLFSKYSAFYFPLLYVTLTVHARRGLIKRDAMVVKGGHFFFSKYGFYC